MSTFSVTALLFLGLATARADSDAALLAAIAMVESGCDRKAIGGAGERGMYQVGLDAWTDAQARLLSKGYTSIKWSDWRSPSAQDLIAAAHLLTLRDRFARAGIQHPSALELALAWNLGFAGARARFYSPNDYARRVVAIMFSHR